MAKADRAKKFWETLRSVSVRQIGLEAARPFAVAIVGDAERRLEVVHALFPGVLDEQVIPDRSLLRTFDSTSPESGFPTEFGAFDLVIDAGGGRVEAPPETPIYSVEEMGGWDRAAERMVEQRPDLRLSMARRFPGLRPAVARRIIQDTATANAEFSMLSALPGVIPIIGPLLPAGAIGDIFMLTKNQAMMLFRLAAIYELPLDPRSRSRELASLLANAFGWRAIAREVVGAVPGGIGLVARGSIAYAGTMALGKGIQRLYETGNQPTRAQIAGFYREAANGAKEIVQGIARRITARRPRRLPK